MSLTNPNTDMVITLVLGTNIELGNGKRIVLHEQQAEQGNCMP